MKTFLFSWVLPTAFEDQGVIDEEFMGKGGRVFSKPSIAMRRIGRAPWGTSRSQYMWSGAAR